MSQRPRTVTERQVAQRKKGEGARTSQSGLWHQLSAWLGHHRQVAGESLRRLAREPLGNLLTWLVIGIAAALPAGLFVATQNLERLAGSWAGSARISVYLKDSVDDATGHTLAERWRTLPGVAGVNFISREQALAEFRQLAGLDQALAQLEKNPLPAVVEITPADSAASPEGADALRRQLAADPSVELAELDLAWLERLRGLLSLAQRMALGLAGLLALGVLLVIANTIRLAIEARREEILVIKLVGGTDAFVRRPFLYTGFWYGLGGGLVAWGLVALGLAALNGPVTQLAGLYNSGFRLSGLTLADAGLLLFLTAELGWLGAWVAATRHLSISEGN